MKWSQGLCAAILMDELYALSPAARRKPRRDLAGAPVDPVSMPNALRADWRLSPEAGRADLVSVAGRGATTHEPPAFTAES
jgi:hypothetical protein